MNETENTDTGTDIEDKEEEQIIIGSYPECAQMKEDTEQLSDRHWEYVIVGKNYG